MAEKAISGSLGTLKKAVQLALGPDLEIIKKDLVDLKGEVKVLGVKQDEMDKRLTSKMDEMDKRLTSKMDEMDKRLTSKMDEMDKRLNGKMDGIDKSLSGKIEEMDKRNNFQFESIRGELRGVSEKVDWAKDIERLKVEVAELKRRR